jgi:D-alanyl-D-alanine endopeptidase (penicillin-binding protein 7)
MTSRARQMGLLHTRFVEPNGLSPDNISTAREMLVILREAIKVPLIREILSQRRYVLTGTNSRGQIRRVTIPNTDRLLSNPQFNVIGGKTGYTDPARYCLAIALRTPPGKELGFVLLGAEGKLTRFADVTRVTRWLARENPVKQTKERADRGRIHEEPLSASERDAEVEGG